MMRRCRRRAVPKMETDGKKAGFIRGHRRMIAIGVAFMLLNVIVLAALFVTATYRDLEKTTGFARETVSFLETTCEKYDNYNQGKASNASQDLSNIANAFAKFLPKERVGIDDSLIGEFVHAEQLSGMIVLDRDGNPEAEFDAEGCDPLSLWGDVLGCSSVKAIYRYGSIDYSDVQERHGKRFAVNVSAYGDGVILLYRELETGSDDRYEYSIDELVAGNTFHENPTVALLEGGKVVSTNRKGTEKSLRRLLVSSKIPWRGDGLTRIEYDGSVWYAERSAYKDYTICVLYPKSEVMNGRFAFVASGLSIYLVIMVIVLVVRGYFDRRTIEAKQKQLDIIDAISSTFESTFLLHLDTYEMEGIRVEGETAEVFAHHPDPADFLENVLFDVVMPEYRATVRALMDTATLAHRLEGKPFLAADIRDSHGRWYSLQVIPQRRDKEGVLTSVLIALRDVSAVKQAEELSYRDSLTGLRNRNYLDSQSAGMIAADNLPVSVIMVDCNYLKRTNDTLGHEWGDRLLQRVAGVLERVAGDERLPMRIGGDEFMLVCPRTGGDEAAHLVADARADLTEVSDDMLTVSASFGVYTVTDADTPFERAFAAADEAMYAEKQKVHEAMRRDAE